MNDETDIKDAVIDQLEEVVNKAREDLKAVMCTEHGQALKTLKMIREEGRFDIKCCCDKGEALVEAAIAKL
jgi:hypothetical protein